MPNTVNERRCAGAINAGQREQQREAEKQARATGRSGARASASFGSQRDTSTEMKTRLSMPSTISSMRQRDQRRPGMRIGQKLKHAADLRQLPHQPGGEEIKPDHAQSRSRPSGPGAVMHQCDCRQHQPIAQPWRALIARQRRTRIGMDEGKGTKVSTSSKATPGGANHGAGFSRNR